MKRNETTRACARVNPARVHARERDGERTTRPRGRDRGRARARECARETSRARETPRFYRGPPCVYVHGLTIHHTTGSTHDIHACVSYVIQSRTCNTYSNTYKRVYRVIRTHADAPPAIWRARDRRRPPFTRARLSSWRSVRISECPRARRAARRRRTCCSLCSRARVSRLASRWEGDRGDGSVLGL